MRGRLAKWVAAAAFFGVTMSGLTAADGAPIAASAGQKTYAKFCCGRQYKPGTFRFGMSAGVTDMSWSKWGIKIARGTGTYQYNDCLPDCASGTIHPTPASVILTGRVQCGGRFLFRHFKLYYAGRKTSGRTFCK